MDIGGRRSAATDKVRKDEGPSTGPGSPKPRAEIGDVDCDLDRQRSGKLRQDRDGLRASGSLFVGGEKKKPLAFDNTFRASILATSRPGPPNRESRAEEINVHHSPIWPCGIVFDVFHVVLNPVHGDLSFEAMPSGLTHFFFLFFRKISAHLYSDLLQVGPAYFFHASSLLVAANIWTT